VRVCISRVECAVSGCVIVCITLVECAFMCWRSHLFGGDRIVQCGFACLIILYIDEGNIFYSSVITASWP